jgi:LmbE family N-acetylglucosaminyl deacetylase
MLRTFWLLVTATMLNLVVASGSSAPSAPQGAELLKTDVLVIFAHPDDETGMAPTLAHYALGKNRRIAAVYATRGEGGGNMVGRHAGAALGLLRESELRQCLEHLGVERLYLLGQLDWAYTESARMTLDFWDADAVRQQIVRLIRVLRPDIIVTMNPIPAPGQHGHHQAIAILSIESFRQSAQPEAYPDQLQSEGLELWQPRKLYISGSAEPYGALIDSDQRLPSGQTAAEVAGRALSHHQSQGFGGMANAPWLGRPRSFRLLYSAVGFEQHESDLFRGVSNSADPTPLVHAEPVTALSPQSSSWRFAARPAIERFRKWSTKHELPGLAASLESDQSVVAGQPNQLLFVTDDPYASLPEDLLVEIDDPWTARLVKSSSTTNHVNVEVLSPATARAPAVLTATWNQNGRQETTLINLKPIPLAEIGEADQPPGPDPFQRDRWAEATLLNIPHTLNWEGTAASDADSSATVQLLYTREAFHALVNVKDDHVVSNIPPNDIRGHWRSDSIEICVDPEARSEHTLSTFKVGIFPFDTDGNARAARDADARQGPIEQTAPGMQLASRRTPAGYEIVTSIPWPLLGVDPRPGHLMGFNILIYDGDKADAAIGENINKSRLAWSPQRGVQGRPEDWGRLRLR